MAVNNGLLQRDPRHGKTLATHRTEGEFHLLSHIIQSSKTKSGERRKKHHYDKRVRQIENLAQHHLQTYGDDIER